MSARRRKRVKKSVDRSRRKPRPSEGQHSAPSGGGNRPEKNENQARPSRPKTDTGRTEKIDKDDTPFKDGPIPAFLLRPVTKVD